MEIKTAVDLSKYQKNSLIVAEVDMREIHRNGQIENLMRNVSDLTKKFDIEDSTTFWVVDKGIDLKALDEKEMAELGWVRKTR